MGRGLAPLAALLICFGAGCDVKSPEPGPVTVQEAFATPAPKGARNNPVVLDSKSRGDVISAALAVIHDRLRQLDEDYDSRAQIEGDLQHVAEKMRPLIEAARSHCDAIHRAASDLRAELPNAQAGYSAAAALYRSRAAGYRDADFNNLTLGLADEFDRLAADTPRRLAVIDAFLVELEASRQYLAETDRCVRDTVTALAVFSTQAELPVAPVDARAFSRRLGEFIQVSLEYEKKLLGKDEPRPAAAPRNIPTSKPAPPTKKVGGVSMPPAGPKPIPLESLLRNGSLLAGRIVNETDDRSSRICLKVHEEYASLRYPGGWREFTLKISPSGTYATLRPIDKDRQYWGSEAPPYAVYKLWVGGEGLVGTWEGEISVREDRSERRHDAKGSITLASATEAPWSKEW